MKNAHASDMDVQKFAFDQSECESLMLKHIKSCKECSERVEVYLLLSKIIKEEPKPSLAYDLSQLVLAQIDSKLEKGPRGSSLVNFIVAVIVGLLILTLFLFGETITYLLNDAQIHQTFFIVSVIGFISSVLVYDLLRSFNKKLKMMNS